MVNKRIIIDPAILAGHPVIAGTRVPVSVILNYLSHGAAFAHIQKDYPELTARDIQAAVSYAEERVKREEVLAV